MAIVKSIHEALKRGATHDEIINQIVSQNPNKAKSIEEARKRGASSLNIISEIIRQNPMSSDFVSETERPMVEKGNKLNQVVQKSAEYNQPTNAYTGREGFLGGVGKTVQNLPSSTYQFGKGLATAAIHPIKTVKGIRDIISGGVVTGLEKLTGTDINQRDSEQEQMFRGIANYMKNRYGGLENLTATAVNDPFGFGTEILAVAQGGASLLGKGKQLEAGLSKAVSPITKPIEKGFTKLGDVVKTGYKKGAQLLEEANLRLTQSQKVNLGKKVDEVTDYITKQKITGSPETRFNKIDAIYNKTENIIDDFLKTNNTAKGIYVSKSKVLEGLEKLKKVLMKDSSDASIIEKQINSTINNIKSQYRGEKIPVNRLNNLKRSTYKNAYTKGGDKVLDAVEHSIGDVYNDMLSDALKGLKINGKTFTEFNKEYGNIIRARKYLKLAQGKSQVGLVGKLVSAAAGGAVGSMAGPGIGTAIGTIAGGNLAELVAGTAARSLLEAGLIKLSEIKIPEFISPDKISKIGIGTSKINK